MPKVSILTPAFQTESTIVRAVKSVLAQTFLDWEMIIIADDGYDYDSFLKQEGIHDKRLKIISTGKNKSGPSHGRNYGLNAATGPFIACLDADDAFHPQKLEKIVPFINQHSLVTSNIFYIDHATEKELHNHNLVSTQGLVDLKTSFLVNLHTNSLLAFNRNTIRCQWPHHITRMEDGVFLAACFDYVDYCYYLPEKLHFYYKRQGSLCNVPNAGKLFTLQCQQILILIREGKIGIRNPHAVAILERFIKRQLRLEALFEEQHANKICVDYQDFMTKNKPIIYDF
ncbi:glycosyltransferase family 2 protein [bacterium]|nr:glycosyltransferase family 2 protein [bacterium]